jgi:hypothetical protein
MKCSIDKTTFEFNISSASVQSGTNTTFKIKEK